MLDLSLRSGMGHNDGLCPAKQSVELRSTSKRTR